MSVTVTPLGRNIAAEIGGVDLTGQVSVDDFEQVRDAFDAHSILVFRDQKLTDAQHIAFSERFGALEMTISFNPHGGGGEITVLSNAGENGSVIPPEDRRMVFNTGNQMWHTDSSFKPVPAMASLLSGKEVPPHDGQTEFASLRAGFESLPPERQAELEGKICVHDFAYSRSKIDPNVTSAANHWELPPVRHPLVRVNPNTGRKSFFTGSHASYIDGMSLAEGRALIAELNDLATQDAFVYRHNWRQHDLVMWDNRCAMHRGRPWDRGHLRVMHRTTIAGVTPTA